MNRAQKSAVMRIPESSDKYPVLKTICRQSINTTVNSSLTGQWSFFREVLMDVSQESHYYYNFFIWIWKYWISSTMCQVTQPCEDMLVACRYGGIDMDCMNIFNAILTDGGLCCNFNGVHRKFMMNLRHKLVLLCYLKKFCWPHNLFSQKLAVQNIFMIMITWKKWLTIGHQRWDFNQMN